MAKKVKIRGRRKPKYSDVETLAYKFGQIQRGLKNPDSLISASFNNGLKEKERKPRKTLF